MAERDALINALLDRYVPQNGGASSDLTTADILSRMPPPAWGGLKSYLPDQPDWMKTAQRAFGSTVIGGMNKLAETLPPGVFDAMTMVMPGARAVRIQNPIRAYHGSPHDFNEFSMSKIGTGEGAQAYGRGLYFAENPLVAHGYRLVPDFNAWRVGREVYNDSSPRHVASFYAAGSGGDRLAAARRLDLAAQEAAQSSVRRQDGRTYQQAAEILRGGDDLPPFTSGRMYDVALHATPESFLDWDKPLAQGGQRVQDALRQLGYADMGQPGSAAYKALSERMGKDVQLGPKWLFSPLRETGEAPLTTALNEAGVPGIRYLDKESRDRAMAMLKEGKTWADVDSTRGLTRNSVVFDPSIIEILRKYGIAGPAALGAMNALSPSDQQ